MNPTSSTGSRNSPGQNDVTDQMPVSRPGHHPRRRFGQNFLHDRDVIEQIINAINPTPEKHMVEIGPGLGALTGDLLTSTGHLHVVEIDRDLAATLESSFHGEPGLNIHVGDALKFDFSALVDNAPHALRVVGNLPYNISTPLLFHLVAHRGAIADLHLLLQREVVERIVAPPGGGDYGRLGVMLRADFRAEMLFTVGPGAFRPAPNVHSALVRLVPHAEAAIGTEHRTAFEQVVAAAFSQRRKTLRNSLRGLLTGEQIADAGIDPGARAQVLTLEQFANLAMSVTGRAASPR